jgi:hypothetical protein
MVDKLDTETRVNYNSNTCNLQVRNVLFEMLVPFSFYETTFNVSFLIYHL